MFSESSAEVERRIHSSLMRRKWVIVIVVLLVAGALTSAGLTAWQVYKLKFWRGPDAMFGDQHLKTTVALVELHKVRYGRYPEKLDDLKFLGDWDAIALNAVKYRVNPTGTRYCIEVERGWIAKPHLEIPPEFWKGTGFDPSLCR